MNLIGLDIGTTSICGVLYSIDENKAIKTETRENLFIEGEKGEYIQDPDSIYEKVKSILDDLIDFSQEKVLAFSLSSQMHGILYIDDFNKALTPFFTWQNQRGLERINEESLEEYLSNMLGYKVYTGYGIVTHYSLFKEKIIPKKAKSFCNIGDYVCMKLAGNTSATTDITIANSMGIFDLKNGKKSDSLKKLGEE